MQIIKKETQSGPGLLVYFRLSNLIMNEWLEYVCNMKL